MQAPPETKNNPTWLEFGIAYIIWALLFLAIYSMALKPRGYTVQAGIRWLKGGKAASKSESKKSSPKAAKLPDMAPDMAPEMGPDMGPDMGPVKPVITPKPVMRHKPMLSEDDD